MQFLILRGHSRLVPQGGLAEFPDAILNAKRLDLFNLYREVSLFICYIMIQICRGCSAERWEILGSQVVSRGGFHVGNGINWKGQVFSKMRNHTLTNRMTVSFPTSNSSYFCSWFLQCCQEALRHSPRRSRQGEALVPLLASGIGFQWSAA